MPPQPKTRRLALFREATDRAMQRVGEQHAVTCRAGCHHCCYQMMTMTLSEAIVAVEYVLMRNEEAFLKHAAHLLPEQAERVDDPKCSYISWFEAQTPCVFLAGGLCSVYEVRPVACRTHVATSDPANCAHGAADNRVQSADTRDIYEAFMVADAQIAQDFGVPRGQYPAPIAVMLALLYRKRGAAAVWDEVRRRMPDPNFPEMEWARLELCDGKTVRPRDGVFECCMCKAVTADPSGEFTCPHCGLDHRLGLRGMVEEAMRCAN
jgi:Fe-S-cluster containining protein